jgi:hypothetical protein
MAKKAIAKKEAGLPAGVSAKAAEASGRGVSSDQDDNLVPLVYVLQAQSPQCLKGHADRIDGAESGDIWLRNLMVIKGEVGILVQPCYFTKDWVEWQPNRGGFAGRHDVRPVTAVEKPIPQKKERTFWELPNGNEVKETRYHIVNIFLPDGSHAPFVIPLSGSGHSFSKQWMFLMNSMKLDNGAVAPSWSRMYRLTTKSRTNADGTWDMFEVADEGWVTTTEQYEIGDNLNDTFERGEKKIDNPQAEGDSDTI